MQLNEKIEKNMVICYLCVSTQDIHVGEIWDYG